MVFGQENGVGPYDFVKRANLHWGHLAEVQSGFEFANDDGNTLYQTPSNLLSDNHSVSVGRRQKTAFLELFSASFSNPVRGVSPAALNAFAAPDCQVYE